MHGQQYDQEFSHKTNSNFSLKCKHFWTIDLEMLVPFYIIFFFVSELYRYARQGYGKSSLKNLNLPPLPSYKKGEPTENMSLLLLQPPAMVHLIPYLHQETKQHWCKPNEPQVSTYEVSSSTIRRQQLRIKKGSHSRQLSLYMDHPQRKLLNFYLPLSRIWSRPENRPQTYDLPVSSGCG
jgi:hypothetical protein